jgi:eukaryotic-like serine/threonine-protein kinase
MAAVWLAVDTDLERPVVVKLLVPAADRARFEREARAVAMLTHPNIVQLFDFGEETRPYMVFEHLAGGSLHARLASAQPLPDDDATRVAKDVAAGLAHAHEQGVVHRDLKPGNVLFDSEGRAKIADFGIARIQGVDTLTDAGTILGTAAYISPEQVRAEECTPATDVYSFGVLLYEMLTGRLPFEADTATELAAMHRDAEPTPVKKVRPDAPGRLAALTASALAKDPAVRPRDGTALVRALDDEGRSSPVAADAPTRALPRPPARRRSRAPMLVACLVTVVVASAGVAAAVLLTHRAPSAPAVPLEGSHLSSTAKSSTKSFATTAQTTASLPATSRRTTSASPRITTGTAASTTVPATQPPPSITESSTTTAVTEPTTSTP